MSGAQFFKSQAKEYSQFRPEYPKELFEFVTSICPARELAWDFACGTGQAARGLSSLFKKVLASDASSEQLQQALAPANVEFKSFNADVDSLGELSLPAHGVDVICVAQAVHWFAHDRFFELSKKALNVNGPLVIWGYGFFKSELEIDNLLAEFSEKTLGKYWSEGNRILVNGYRDLYFPLKSLKTPTLQMTAEWNVEQILGYLHSWSATQKYKDSTGQDPVMPLRDRLQKLVGERKIHLDWNLSIKAGRF